MDNDKLKRIIIYVVSAIIILTIILIITNKKSVTPELKLVGEEKIVLEQYDTYTEPGYNIINDDNSGYYVNIDGKVNTSIVGVYNISYRLYNKQAVLLSTVIRKVVVLENDLTNINFVLNGSKEEYFFVGDYHDLGAKAYENYEDISDRITVVDSVNQNQVGTYKVEYQIINGSNIKQIDRIVNIVDFNVKESISSQNQSLNLIINNTNYSYTILPSGGVSTSNSIIYKYNASNKIYEFDIYLKSGSHKKYTVNLNNIANDKLVGSCTLAFSNNTTIISMKMNDPSKVARYNVNGLDFYSTAKTINGYVGNVTVNAYNNAGDATSIKCKNTLSQGIKTINSNKLGWFPYNVNITNDNLELEAIVQSYGYKTRDAVAAAGIYLANYKYDIQYFWGGKSTQKGINPAWGKHSNHKVNQPCSKPKDSSHSICEYGLDCTGYTAWAFAQAGFDASTIREHAQESKSWGAFDPTQAGHSYKFGSQNRVHANKIKPGDLVTVPGDHAGLVIGVTDDTIQVAHEINGIKISIIDKNTGKAISGEKKDFTVFVLFDDYYNMYGNK